MGRKSCTAKSLRHYKIDISNPDAVREAAEKVKKEVGHP